jgi:predicted helicase
LLRAEFGKGDLVKNFGPRDVFDWIYAVLHSPAYRSRYAEFLKTDYPRIPIPGSKDLFTTLTPLGAALIDLHLLKHGAIKALTGPVDARFAGSGKADVAKGFPKWKNGRAAINASRWFEEVPEEIWSFHIGGYQVCKKWLKDRRGRTLSDADILHYRRIVVVVAETIALMEQIDEVIDEHGGWPNAFRGMSS